jgi:hypothetical protein
MHVADQATVCRLKPVALSRRLSVGTIENLKNPRAFVRELVRLTKPLGGMIVTTPNQRSLLSIMSLVVKRRFSHFQDVHYPAHLTALLEIDLMRIGSEWQTPAASA